MKILGVLIVFFAAILQTARAADSEMPESSNADWQKSFDKGNHEGAVGAAIYFSPFGATKNRPVENYVGPLGQIGYMLNKPNHGKEWRGNFEVLGELYGADIFNGRGNYVASGTAWLRYNLVPPRWRFVPYLQLGAGVTFTDADQKAFGEVFNFNTDAAVGLRYFITSNCSLNGEYRFQHISNAGLAKHNLGINAQGAALSVSWFF